MPDAPEVSCRRNRKRHAVQAKYPFDKVISEKESIMSLEIDEDILSGYNSIYAETGFSFQAFARRELIKIAKSGKCEWPVILNMHGPEKDKKS